MQVIKNTQFHQLLHTNGRFITNLRLYKDNDERRQCFVFKKSSVQHVRNGMACAVPWHGMVVTVSVTVSVTDCHSLTVCPTLLISHIVWH